MSDEVIEERTSSRSGQWRSFLLIAAMVAAAVLQIAHYHPMLESHTRLEPQHMMDPQVWKIQNHIESKKQTTNQIKDKPTSNDKAKLLDKPPSSSNSLLKLLEEAGLLQADERNHHLLLLHNNSNNKNTTTVQIQNLTLPSWPTLQSLYGDLSAPRIVGLERCASYRQAVPLSQRYTGVAGMFNTGTNAMEFHLKNNILARHTWQIPWGKHRMPFVRLKHAANGLEKNDQTKALPIVLIRDPFHWMQSMCGQPYAAKWEHTRQHCPNLVPSPADRKKFGADAFANDTVPIKVIFDKDQKFYWPSIVHLYNDYYLQYLKDADYPRLMVRFEDMLLMPHAVLEQIAQCVGVATAEHLKFQTGSSKGHGSHTNFVNAIVKTGNIERRTMGMTREDILFAAEHLDKELLETFQYTVPIV